MKLRIYCAIVLTIFTACHVAPCLGATISSERLEKGGAVIFVEGDLEYGDERLFANVAVPLDSAIVVFRSNGGNLKAGIDIGKSIRLKGFLTVVPDGQSCASACALAWLGGRVRLMGKSARVGFHAAYTNSNGEKEPTAVGNALVGAYLSQLGMPERAIIYMTGTAPTGIQWLTFADAEQVGIEVKPFDMSETGNRSPSSPQRTANAARDWTSFGEWIQIYSRPTLIEATQIGSEFKKTFPNTMVFRYANSWYGVVLGPYPTGEGLKRRDVLMLTGKIPTDSLITRGEKFQSLEFGEGPSVGSARGSAPDLEARAISFMTEFHQAWSADNAIAMANLNSIYAERISYYEKMLPRSEVLREKRDFVERWPNRTYRMRAGSVTAQCAAATSECVVSGIVEWRVSSQARAATSEGSARYELRVAFAGPRPTVLAETGVVLSRTLGRR